VVRQQLRWGSALRRFRRHREFSAARFIDYGGWFDIFTARFNDKNTHLNSFYGKS
jgi:hypothetical protein